jgi:hypothetical protein
MRCFQCQWVRARKIATSVKVRGFLMKFNYPKIAEHLGVPLRGNETFTELLEIEKQVKENKERKERIAEQNANIQRVDAQTKKHWSK